MSKRLIKRYSNRKLYDTISKKFITLKDIAKFINKGEGVRIIEKESGKDVTSSITARLLQQHFSKKEGLLDISEKSPLELIKKHVSVLKAKRALEVLLDLINLRSKNRKMLGEIIDELIEEGFLNKKMALEAEAEIWKLLSERDVLIESEVVERMKRRLKELGYVEREKYDWLQKENAKLRTEIKRLKSERWNKNDIHFDDESKP